MKILTYEKGSDKRFTRLFTDYAKGKKLSRCPKRQHISVFKFRSRILKEHVCINCGAYEVVEIGDIEEDLADVLEHL